MRMMPKISVRPQAMKKRIAACDSALRHCARAKLANSKPYVLYVLLRQSGVICSRG